MPSRVVPQRDVVDTVLGFARTLRHAELSENPTYFFRRQLTILVAEGINGRIDQKLGNREPLRKLRQREDGGLIPDYERTEKLPHRPLRRR